jgi:hypothetical protein
MRQYGHSFERALKHQNIAVEEVLLRQEVLEGRCCWQDAAAVASEELQYGATFCRLLVVVVLHLKCNIIS